LIKPSFSTAIGAVGIALAVRLLIEVPWVLPSPVGDPAYFLTASVNYCRSGFLGTTAFSVDPTGHARMIWHGFVSPMLFGILNPPCSASVFYGVLWGIKALTAAAILLLARRRAFSPLVACGLAAFALIAQSVIAFRPETLAILVIVAAELAYDFDRPMVFGLLLGTLLCTQPTVAGIYGLVLLIARFRWLWNRKLRIGLSYGIAVLLLLLWYPYSLSDLINGIALQAKLLMGRSDGGLIWYYVLAPFLPLWGALLIAAWWLVIVKNRVFLALAPALWFFGPRLPPTYYNLVPICFILMILASACSSRRAANLLGAGSLGVAVLGLTLLTTRDVLTVARYGDTFDTTRRSVDRLTADGLTFGVLPSFIALTNPALRVTDPNVAPGSPAARDSRVSAYAVNGRPTSPCAGDEATSLSIGSLRLFNTNSGWTIYLCRGPG
jgi:uncharacterized membrane protein